VTPFKLNKCPTCQVYILRKDWRYQRR